MTSCSAHPAPKARCKCVARRLCCFTLLLSPSALACLRACVPACLRPCAPALLSFHPVVRPPDSLCHTRAHAAHPHSLIACPPIRHQHQRDGVLAVLQVPLEVLASGAVDAVAVRSRSSPPSIHVFIVRATLLLCLSPLPANVVVLVSASVHVVWAYSELLFGSNVSTSTLLSASIHPILTSGRIRIAARIECLHLQLAAHLHPSM